MNSMLASRIAALDVPARHLGIFWLAQAGFVFKTPAGTVVYVDAYLTDCVHRLLGDQFYGFKRIIPSPISPEDVSADLVVCTHSHADHFDYDAMPILARNPKIAFVAAPDCRQEFAKLGISEDRFTILHRGERLSFGDVTLTGIFADHGELAPDALGVLLEVAGLRIWHTGDTAYRPDAWQDLFQTDIDVLIPPINGAFGNLDGVEAAKLAHDSSAAITIPSHFWMFAEHGGDPAQFLEACKLHAPATRPWLMTQGELLMVPNRS